MINLFYDKFQKITWIDKEENMEKIKSPSVNSASLEGLKIANNTHKKEYYENVSTIEDYNLNDTN